MQMLEVCDQHLDLDSRAPAFSTHKFCCPTATATMATSACTRPHLNMIVLRRPVHHAKLCASSAHSPHLASPRSTPHRPAAGDSRCKHQTLDHNNDSNRHDDDDDQAKA